MPWRGSHHGRLLPRNVQSGWSVSDQLPQIQTHPCRSQQQRCGCDPDARDLPGAGPRPPLFLHFCPFSLALLQEILLSVSPDLAPKLDGAVLHFGKYNQMQRFIWLSMPAVKGHPCVCRRSIGAPAGKRSPCLDDPGVGLSDP